MHIITLYKLSLIIYNKLGMCDILTCLNEIEKIDFLTKLEMSLQVRKKLIRNNNLDNNIDDFIELM